MEVSNVRMKNKIVKVLSALMATFLILVYSPQVQAEDSCTLSLPVDVEVTGKEVPSDATYSFQIEALTPSAPMPSNTVVSRTGAGQVNFDPIVYTMPGDYTYRVTQVSVSRKDMKFDTSSYEVTVRVLNGDNGQLNVVWARKDGSTDKVDAIRFVNQSTSKPKKATTNINTGWLDDNAYWFTIAALSLCFVGFFLIRSKQKYKEM